MDIQPRYLETRSRNGITTEDVEKTMIDLGLPFEVAPMLDCTLDQNHVLIKFWMQFGYPRFLILCQRLKYTTNLRPFITASLHEVVGRKGGNDDIIIESFWYSDEWIANADETNPVGVVVEELQIYIQQFKNWWERFAIEVRL